MAGFVGVGTGDEVTCGLAAGEADDGAMSLRRGDGDAEGDGDADTVGAGDATTAIGGNVGDSSTSANVIVTQPAARTAARIAPTVPFTPEE